MKLACGLLLLLARSVYAEEPVHWPTSVLERQLTLPDKLVQVGGDVYGGSATTADAVIGIGLTNELELNTVAPTFSIHPLGPLDVGLGYKILRNALDGRLEVDVRAVGGYDLDLAYTRPLRLGLQIQFVVTPLFAVISHDLGAGNLGASIGLDHGDRSFAVAPFGVGFQLTQTLWIEAETSAIAAKRWITELTPVYVTAVLNVLGGRVDLIGYAGAGDVQALEASYSVGVGTRVYLGQL